MRERFHYEELGLPIESSFRFNTLVLKDRAYFGTEVGLDAINRKGGHVWRVDKQGMDVVAALRLQGYRVVWFHEWKLLCGHHQRDTEMEYATSSPESNRTPRPTKATLSSQVMTAMCTT